MVKIHGKKYVSLKEVHERDMRDPKYRKAYETLQPRLAIIRELIRLRVEKNMTQLEIAKKIGSHQSAIARFESGSYNPSFKFVQEFAVALGMRVQITK